LYEIEKDYSPFKTFIMKNYAITLDLRSIMIGMFASLCILMSISFSSVQEPSVGVFETAASDEGYIVLNKQTGEFGIYRDGYATPMSKFDFDKIDYHKSMIKKEKKKPFFELMK